MLELTRAKRAFCCPPTFDLLPLPCLPSSEEENLKTARGGLCLCVHARTNVLSTHVEPLNSCVAKVILTQGVPEQAGHSSSLQCSKPKYPVLVMGTWLAGQHKLTGFAGKAKTGRDSTDGECRALDPELRSRAELSEANGREKSRQNV